MSWPNGCPTASAAPQAFFCNSGAEAAEAAIKYARRATGKPGIVALEGSFHGRTLGALAVTGQPDKRAAFEPLVPGVRFARADDEASLAAAVDETTGLHPAGARARRGRGPAARRPTSSRRRASSRMRSVRCSSSTRCRPASAGPGASSASSGSACGPMQ